MKPYSIDLRERVLADCGAGVGTKAVAEKFSVSPAWVRRLKQRHRDDGTVAPRSSRNRRVPKLAPHAGRIRDLVAATPDLTLAELRDALGVRVALATLWAAVAGLGLTLKKKSSAPRSRTGPT
jgi:transposase